MIRWPDTLIRELAERRAIIIVGAGASANCTSSAGTRLPTWQLLLDNLATEFLDPAQRADFDSYVAKERFLEAAEIVITAANATGRGSDYSEMIRRTFDHRPFDVGQMYKDIVSIDSRVVISANFDEILDNYCRNFPDHAYSVCQYYEDHGFKDVRSSRRLLLKAHGSTTDITRIILTRSEFYKARQQYGRFYELLGSLFLTNTILFIGHSIRDPDLSLLLEYASIIAPSNHPHYALVEDGRPQIEYDIFKRTNNIETLRYPQGQHHEAVEALSQLALAVEALRSSSP